MKGVQRLLAAPGFKTAAWVGVCLPAAWLLWGAVQGSLGANPAERLIRDTGEWTLRWLCATLAITPLRHHSGWQTLLRHRRLLGVTTFCYACLHLLAYAWLDMGLEPADIGRDILKRPFIAVGMAAALLMAPLAATSFNRAIKAMGAARWQKLHRLVYAIALLAVLHFFWMRSAKQNFEEVAVYAAIVAMLLGWRVWRAARRRFTAHA